MLTKNTLYLAMTFAMLAMTLSYINAMVPNSLWYYVQTYLMF